MHGFICNIALNNKITPVDFKWKKPFPFQGAMIKREIIEKTFQSEQFTSEKFIQEKLWINNDDFMFISEGLIVNLDLLMNEYAAGNASELIYKLYRIDKRFFSKFDGSFAGVFYNKRENAWYAFNNHSGTKRLFFFKSSNHLLVATDLYTLVKALKELNYSISADEQAAYLLLTSRIMFEDMTLVSEVRQILAGEFLSMADGKISTDFYFHLSSINKIQHSKKVIIENLDEKFSQALKLQHEIDLKHNYSHLTTLSGGLDSRTELLCAYEYGFTNQTAFNFSHKGYADQLISRQIADSVNIPLIQFTLQPESLLPIDDVIAVNDGLIIYTGCFHIFSVLSEFDNQPFGAVHTGIMGDTIMGSSVTKDRNRIKNRLYTIQAVFPEQINYINNLLSHYKNEELGLIYNLIFFGESNGFLYFDLIGNTLSPFLNTAFMSYAYSIPDHLKYNRALYIDWIKKFHPQAADFTWETQACKPTNNMFLRQFHRYKRAIVKRLPINSMWKNNLAPAQQWYDRNESIKNPIDRYFYENIDRITNQRLKNDVLNLYKEKDFDLKASCVTLVGAYKLLFD